MTRLRSSILAAIFLGLGCSTPGVRPHVHGKVTFDGQPVGNASLTLVSDGEGSDFFIHRIPLMPDGAFSADVPEPGTYKVVVEESLAALEGNAPDAPRLKIPARYTRRETTDLRWTIQPGDNALDLALAN